MILFHFILLLILLAFSAFFSSSETAFFSLTAYERKKISESKPNKAKIIEELLKEPATLIFTIVIGNTIVNVMATSIMATIIFFLYPGVNYFISLLIVTAVILLSGEVSPKLIALRIYQRLVIYYIYPLNFFYRLLFPFRRYLLNIVSKVLDAFAIKELTTEPSLDEVEAIVKAGEKEGLVESKEGKMIERLFDLSRRSVDEIMTPRVNMVALNKEDSKEKLVAVIKESRHSRIPVYENNIDTIIGIVYAKDVLFSQQNSWSHLIQPVLFVPESMKIDELLYKLKEKDEDVAIVIDEYGGTSGIVTIEDIVEEIVGEIEEEWKKGEDLIETLDANTFTVRADISLKQLSEFLKVNLETEEADTLSGLLMYLFGEVPSSGQYIEYKGLKFFIDDVQRNRIRKVTIKRN